jgi:hypothetical protein
MRPDQSSGWGLVSEPDDSVFGVVELRSVRGVRCRPDNLGRADSGSGVIVKGRVLKGERRRIWLLID